MPVFGKASLAKLETCHEEIQQVCFEVIPIYDFTIICGRREEEAQNQAFHDGFSGVRWPDSKHNAEPPELSDAVDIAPWHSTRLHVRWKNELEFVQLSGYMLQAAAALGIKLRWGGDWNQDHDLYDINKPFDLCHFERIAV